MGLRLFFLVLGVLVVLRVAFLSFRSRGRSTFKATQGPLSGIPKNDLRNLRSICRGNAGQMNRLIEHEKNRHPGISNREACRRVIASFSRDNR